MVATVGEAMADAVESMRPISDSPGTDSQLLMAETLGQSRTWVLAHRDHELTAAELAGFKTLVGKVVGGAALPHVIGWWEFYGRRFQIDPNVLIPRPETELLIDHALDLNPPPSGILDLGTGSGCIAITLAHELPNSTICASDISPDALKIARRNIQTHVVEDSVWLVHANLLQPFGGTFDLICANLPYIATEELATLVVASQEPKIALDGGNSGIELISETLEGVPALLASGGTAMFEIDPDQATVLGGMIEAGHPKSNWQIHKDLSGRDRLLIIESD